MHQGHGSQSLTPRQPQEVQVLSDTYTKYRPRPPWCSPQSTYHVHAPIQSLLPLSLPKRNPDPIKRRKKKSRRRRSGLTPGRPGATSVYSHSKACFIARIATRYGAPDACMTRLSATSVRAVSSRSPAPPSSLMETGMYPSG